MYDPESDMFGGSSNPKANRSTLASASAVSAAPGIPTITVFAFQIFALLTGPLRPSSFSSRTLSEKAKKETIHEF